MELNSIYITQSADPDHASLTASTASNEGVYIDSPQLASHSVLIFATLFLSYSKRRCTLFALDNLYLTLFANNTNLGALREMRRVRTICTLNEKRLCEICSV